MIPFWNRKELTMTLSLDRQTEIRSLLTKHGIDYLIKTRYSRGSYSQRTFRPAHMPEYSAEYYIYVRRSDYDNAKRLIRK